MHGIAHFRDFGDQKIQVGRDQKINGKIFTSLSLTNVSIHLWMTLNEKKIWMIEVVLFRYHCRETRA